MEPKRYIGCFAQSIHCEVKQDNNNSKVYIYIYNIYSIFFVATYVNLYRPLYRWLSHIQKWYFSINRKNDAYTTTTKWRNTTITTPFNLIVHQHHHQQPHQYKWINNYCWYTSNTSNISTIRTNYYTSHCYITLQYLFHLVTGCFYKQQKQWT